MERESAMVRRLLGALLVSVLVHGFLITSFKPASAHYAGDPFLKTRLTPLNASLEAPPAGRGAKSPTQPSSAGKREHSTMPRRLVEDSRLTKSYLAGWEARAGNLPDGREAVELDTRLLNQYYTAREVDVRAEALEAVPL